MNQTNIKLKPEEIWYQYYQKYKGNTVTQSFINLYQFVQGKTYSEAICETVGSIMKIHIGRGRNLHPVNFGKEIFLRFNLPPLHSLTSNYIPKIVKMKLDEKTEYFRKLQFTRNEKLKYVELSASVGNFRKSEEDKTHLPISWVQ